MARIQGIIGGISGKMGNAVFRQNHGETVISQYQPIVTNPNTKAQQDVRAKFKLVSQVAAMVAPVIAIPRRGASTSRNQFTKVNYPSIREVTIEDVKMEAINITDIKLTESQEAFEGLFRNLVYDAGVVDVTMEADSIATYDEVVCVALSGTSTLSVNERPARYRGSVRFLTSESGAKSINVGRLEANERLYILSYGIRHTSKSSKTSYNNQHGIDDAIGLSTQLRQSASGYQLTDTKGEKVPE